MKKFKISLAAVAVVFAITASAFTGIKTTQVYHFTGNDSEIYLESGYTAGDGPVGFCTGDPEVPCRVEIPEEASLQDALDNAENTNQLSNSIFKSLKESNQ